MMIRTASVTTLTVALLATLNVQADELLLMIEQDLAAMGYETGPVDGEETMETIVAISKFQAENQLEVTGEASPQLARAITTRAANPNAAPAAAAPARGPAELQAAQQACIQEKMAAAQASQKKKRGFGRLFKAVARTAGQMGNHDIGRTTSDIYSANATAEDLSAAAEDLGLTEDDVAACRNP